MIALALLMLIVTNSSCLTFSVPLIFIYVIKDVKNDCSKKNLSYLAYSLQQAKAASKMQSSADSSTVNNTIYFGTNIMECSNIIDIFPSLNMTKSNDGIVYYNINEYKSEKRLKFENLYDNTNMMSKVRSQLWLYSTLRFLLLEDFMNIYGHNSFIHVEGDVMLYGNLNNHRIISQLVSKYAGLAATPLTKQFTTASVLWCSDKKYMEHFNNYLLALTAGQVHEKKKNRGGNQVLWDKYKYWLITNTEGNIDGVLKPYAINEMSILSYYQTIYPRYIRSFQIIPSLIKYNSSRSSVVAVGNAIFDSGSYGQFIGGTESRHGNNKNFTDSSHLIGQFIIQSHSIPTIACVPIDLYYRVDSTASTVTPTAAIQQKCFTAPVVVYNKKSYLLWNLHIHSKLNHLYSSVPCECT